jgi:beta-fructofuranosidase
VLKARKGAFIRVPPPVLRLPGEWIWDSWIVDDGERYHLFFLRAPATPDDPVQRHTSARIGHAVSADLVIWEDLGVALAPAATGAWDDLAVWTGSIARGDDGVWRMYYTAISTAGRGVKDQRLGLAESPDLTTWERVGDRPLLDVDARWYRTLDDARDASETWRDPFVFRDPDGDGWHMLVSARVPTAPRNEDGVLALARSADMVAWELRPPLTAPAGFGQLEVAQVRHVDGRWILVFTCHPDEQSAARRARFGDYATWVVAGDAPAGPWDIASARPFTAEPHLFAAPLVQERDGGWAFVGFRNREALGDLTFEISDPIRVGLDDDGVRLTTRPARR